MNPEDKTREWSPLEDKGARSSIATFVANQLNRKSEKDETDHRNQLSCWDMIFIWDLEENDPVRVSTAEEGSTKNVDIIPIEIIHFAEVGSYYIKL